MKEIELKIPNLGEAEDTEIIEISVKKGDKLSKNDPIIVLESEKAAMEVPSDFDGKIKDIKVKEGDSVREGTVFAVIEVEDNEESKEVKEEINTSPTETSPIEDKSQIIEKASIDFSGINAGPAVRKIARELEIDIKKIIGSDKQKLTNSFLPPLLKFYLRLGGKVSDHAVIDKDLDTLHVFTYLDLNGKKN